MTHRSIGVALALGAAISAGGAALAQGVAQPAHTDTDVSSFAGTPDTLIHVIQRVETMTGGQVVEVRYSDAGGAPGFFAAYAKDGNVSFVRLAREDGVLTAVSEQTRPAWMMRWSGRQDLKAAERAKVTLAQAIRTAEDQSRAPAVAAGISPTAANGASDVKAYNVLVLRDGQTHRLAIDDSTDQVIQDPQALAQ